MARFSKNSEIDSLLGKTTEYPQYYQPEILFPISRSANRTGLGIDSNSPLPFYGFDSWNAYELSWLNSKGKPVVAVGEIIFAVNALYLVESKSFKLYLHSLNNRCFRDSQEVIATISHDLSQATQHPVEVYVYELNTLIPTMNFLNCQPQMSGICIDNLDIEINTTLLDHSYLKISDEAKTEAVEEILTSNLLKSNCPVTHQPDWGSLQIAYRGPQIDHSGLLKYIVSFRHHHEFSENCIERIFTDIKRYCHPTTLSVTGRFTRRGGLDINPFRSTEQQYEKPERYRLIRQ